MLNRKIGVLHLVLEVTDGDGKVFAQRTISSTDAASIPIPQIGDVFNFTVGTDEFQATARVRRFDYGGVANSDDHENIDEIIITVSGPEE